MNRRLFWKILIIFWGIFYLTFQLIWIGVNFYIEAREVKTFYFIPTKVEMIAQLLQISGEQEAVNFISHLPEPERNHFAISLFKVQDSNVELSTTETKGTNFVYQKTAKAPDGLSYLISFKDPETNYEQGSIFNMPISMFLMGIAGGLLFSLFLAWNLTRPIRLIRGAFYNVSQGDLSVRLFDKLRSRHDELSELANDFDLMVEKLDILISDRQALLHDVSHELRTPLARLQLAIGIAQQNTNNIDTSLQRIELESHRLDKLIGEILTYSRLEVVTSLDEYFDLKTLVGVIVDDAKYEAEPQDIEVIFTSTLIVHSIIKGNAEQIRRAVENIVRNSIRFSKAGQQVEVSLKESGRFLKIEVSDHGPGVEAPKLSTIFEPFVRIQSPELGKGYGLGLAIAKKSIAMHQGTIQARNRDTGRGLIISIKLPYWRP